MKIMVPVVAIMHGLPRISAHCMNIQKWQHMRPLPSHFDADYMKGSFIVLNTYPSAL